jgi:hypothetical protein
MKNFLLIILIGIGLHGFGQVTTFTNTNPQVQQTNGSNIDGSPSQTHFFITGDNVTQILVECWGAGGGGSYGKSNGRAVAGGGGGAYARSTITVSPCTAYTVVVGGGGEGWQQIGDGTEDQLQRPGRPSYFATTGGIVLVQAAGGNSARTNRHDKNGLGGATADCIGDVTYKGGDGAWGTLTVNSGGGGGGAGSDGTGNDATGVTGGLARTFGGGNGGNGRTSNGGNGFPGVQWGGGGSGAWKSSGPPNRIGGFGAHGAVRITILNGSGACTLPVTLISFTTNCNVDNVEINWKTASEYNSSHYILQNSRDGQNWFEVVEIQSVGTTNQESNYSYQDKSFGGISYYRLVQVDFDGVYEIFGPISANCEINDNKLEIYPNPTNGDIDIIIKSINEFTDLTIEVVDIFGRVVLSRKINNTQINIFTNLETNILNSGLYIVRIKNQKSFEQIKLMKVN